MSGIDFHPRRTVPIALLALLALAGAAWADDEICEDLKGEAGSVPSTAYRAVGTGPLRVINGSLSNSGPMAGDDLLVDSEDVYLVQIVDPGLFMARTVVPGEPPLFDTSLWLFNPCAGAALANLQKPGMPGTPFALLLPDATDASGFVLTQPGPYYIGISGGFRLPRSAGGEMFIFANPQEISGPDGPGAELPLVGWDGSMSDGNYRVLLDGVFFLGLQPSCSVDFNGDQVVDGADLGILLGSWGACPIPGPCKPDINGDGKVDGADIGLLLAAWGPCPLIGTPCGDPAAGSCFEANGTAGCSDPCCCFQICQLLPHCCDASWDAICAQTASSLCSER